MYSFPMGRDNYGATGALVKMDGGPAGGGAGTIVYFECEDCSVEAGRVQAMAERLRRINFQSGCTDSSPRQRHRRQHVRAALHEMTQTRSGSEGSPPRARSI
jgi:hypothetical protein